MIDSFAHYRDSNGQLSQNKWFSSSSGSVNQQDSLRTGARAYQLNWGDHDLYRIGLGPFTRVYVGFAGYHESNITSHCFYIGNNGDWNNNLYVSSSTGQIGVRRGSTVLATSDTGVWNQDTWKYIEIKWRTHATLGEVEVRVNGTVVIDETNINTLGSGTADQIDRIYFNQSSNNYLWYFTDFYLDDSQFHGPCRVDCLRPDDNGHYTDFTPSTGQNYETVDDLYAASGSDYNSITQVGKDTYTFDNLSGVTGPIKGVQVTNCIEKVGGSAVKAKAITRISSTDYQNSEEHDLANDYKYEHSAVWEVNPATASPWSESEVNGAEFGVEITAMSTTTTTTSTTTTTTTTTTTI